MKTRAAGRFYPAIPAASGKICRKLFPPAGLGGHGSRQVQTAEHGIELAMNTVKLAKNTRVNGDTSMNVNSLLSVAQNAMADLQHALIAPARNAPPVKAAATSDSTTETVILSLSSTAVQLLGSSQPG